MLDIATLLASRQQNFPLVSEKVSFVAPEWPSRLIPGVHSYDAASLIVPNLPGSLCLGRELREKALRSFLRIKNRATGARRNDSASGSAYGLGGDEVPLVSNSIFDRTLPLYLLQPQETVTYYSVYHRDTYLCRCPPSMPPREHNGSTRGTIFELSSKSRSRLKFICDNSGHRIRSQFCLTYHDQDPTDGVTVKNHLASFKKVLRRMFPDVGFIWVLEFQKRGTPHFHVFLTIPPDRDRQEKLASAWVRITGGTTAQKEWHGKAKNWVEWNMDNGNYIVDSYLTKQVQKDVPAHYHSVGRFWGISRNMVPVPTLITSESIASRSLGWAPSMVEHFVARCFRRLQENQMNTDRFGNRRAGKKKKASILRQQSELGGSFKIRHGSRALMQIIHYSRFNPPDCYTVKHVPPLIPF